MSRQLGPSDYGLLTVTVIIIVWVETAVSLGLSRAAVKLVAEAGEGRNAQTLRILQAQVLLSLAAALMVVAIAPALSTWLDDPQLKNTLRLLSLDIPVFGITEVLIAIMMGRGAYRAAALMKALYWLGRAGLIFLLVTLIPNVAGALLAILGASVVVMICSVLIVHPCFVGERQFSFQNLWGYSWPLFMYTVGMQLFSISDLVFVKALAGAPQAAGFYGAAKNLAIVPSIFAASFSPILIAKLTELSRKGNPELARSMSRQSIRIVFCFLPFSGMAAGAAPEVVTAIYGEPFLPSAPTLAVLIFGTSAVALISVTVSILIAAGHFKWPFVLIMPLLVLAFAGQIFLVPRFGGTGSACVTTTVACIGAFLMLRIAGRICHIRMPVLSLLRSLIVCIIAYILSYSWPSPGIMVGIKLLLIGNIIVLLFYMLGELRKSDFAFLREIMRHTTTY